MKSARTLRKSIEMLDRSIEKPVDIVIAYHDAEGRPVSELPGEILGHKQLVVPYDEAFRGV